MMKHSAFLLSIFGAVACGDDVTTAPDAPPVVKGPPRAVIVAGDFKALGVLSTIDPATQEVKINVGPAMAVGSDPMLRHHGDELFIVNRAENNITILDDQSLALKEQLGTGANSNPQDVAVVGDKLYAPTYGTRGVTVLTRGSTATTEIDLSADDPDGEPNCNSAYTVGTDVYVSCQLLSGFPPTVAGKVYVIDSTTDTVKPDRTITLLHKNPFGLFEQIPPGTLHAGDLLMPTVEDFVAPGCVERFTPGATPSASSCWVKGADLRGYASRIAFQMQPGNEVTFFAVPTVFPNSDLIALDMPTDLLWPGTVNKPMQAIVDVAVCPEGELVLYDGTAAASGLRVYRGDELTKAALPIGIENGMFSTHGLVCY